MTDRECLFAVYGVLKVDGVGPDCALLEFVSAHLFPPDKPSEPAPVNFRAPSESEGTYQASASMANYTLPKKTPSPTPIQREPGTPGVDRPLKRSDVLIDHSVDSKGERV